MTGPGHDQSKYKIYYSVSVRVRSRWRVVVANNNHPLKLAYTLALEGGGEWKVMVVVEGGGDER